MRIEQWDPADEQTTRACYDVMLAAHAADEPIEPPQSPGLFAAFLLYGWEKTPAEFWVATADDGSVVGYHRIGLPDLENLDKAFGGPTVHPAVRRRGIGRELLRHAGARAQAHGRTQFDAEVTTGGDGDAFAQAVGAKLDLEEVRRMQYLREIAPGTVATLRAAAEKAADGYTLVSWDGAIPDQYRAGMAGVFNAFNDAPHGENEEPAIWDADRVRERTGIYERLGLVRAHSIAAIADATGEMAAYSEVSVCPDQPACGYQQLTAVTRPHRGHRLGLLVKTAMLELLAEAEPELEWIATGNAATNEHMIAVNEQLGYRVVEPGYRDYQISVADMLR
ncbi:MAG TPA: GNAT family N-acetyltransferase [Trebonia sp.]